MIHIKDSVDSYMSECEDDDGVDIDVNKSDDDFCLFCPMLEMVWFEGHHFRNSVRSIRNKKCTFWCVQRWMRLTSLNLRIRKGNEKFAHRSHYNKDPVIFIEQNGMDQTTAKTWVEDQVLDS